MTKDGCGRDLRGLGPGISEERMGRIKAGGGRQECLRFCLGVMDRFIIRRNCWGDVWHVMYPDSCSIPGTENFYSSVAAARAAGIALGLSEDTESRDSIDFGPFFRPQYPLVAVGAGQ